MGLGRLPAFLVAFTLTWNLAAQTVALVRPEPTDLVLVDAFNRLAAELAIHRFDPKVARHMAGGDPSTALAAVARESGALASIAFLQRNGKTSVDVWLVDRVSGKTTMRTIEVGRGSDASSVLAIRAVDLLRQSFREVATGERPPKDVPDVDRRPVPAAVTTLAAPEDPDVTLRAEAALLVLGPDFGVAYGPAVGVFHSFGGFALAVVGSGPLVGASLETPAGSASTVQELLFMEGRLRILRTSLFEAAAGLDFGAHFLQAEGRAKAPRVSKSDDTSALLGGVGGHADLRLSSHFSLSVSVRGLVLVPRMGVAVGEESRLLPAPIVDATLGFGVGL